jgi:hypothetical protein
LKGDHILSREELLHRLWVSGEIYEPLRNQRVLIAAA